MPERKTLLYRPQNAPVAQPAQQGAPSGAFGDFSGLQQVARGLSDVGNATFDYQMRLKKEMEDRTMNDFRLQQQNAMDVAALGVREQYKSKLLNGDFQDGSSFAWMEQATQDARQAVNERIGHSMSHPLFEKAVPHGQFEQDWFRRMSPLLEDAKEQEAVARMRSREEGAMTMATAAFATYRPGDYEALNQEMLEKTSVLNSLAISKGTKAQAMSAMSSGAYAAAARGALAGKPVPQWLIDNPNLSQAQKLHLEELNTKLLKPAEPFSNDAEATKVLNDALNTADLASDPRNASKLQAAQIAAAYLGSKASSPEGILYPKAKLDLKIAEQRITKNNFETVSTVSGMRLYQRLSTMSEKLRDAAGADAFYESIGVKGADSSDKSAFIEAIRKAADLKLGQINTGHANRVVDSGDVVGPFARAAVAEFNSETGLSAETAQAYVKNSRIEQTRLGIPEHLQVHVPDGIVNTVLDRIWNHDSNNGVRMLNSMGGAFGSSSLRTLSRSLLTPEDPQKPGQARTPTGAKNAALAAYVNLVAIDHARVETGGGKFRLEMTDYAKRWMDDLLNFEKNNSSFPVQSKLVATKAYNLSSFKDPVSEKELLTMEQITKTTSKIQSLPGIERALLWSNNQNPDLSTGFKELFSRVIQARAYGAGGDGAGGDKISREVVAAQTAGDINNSLAQLVTVVPVNGVSNTKQVLDLVPTQILQEGPFDLPHNFGAANAVDMGEQIGNVLQYSSHYEPRRHWDRGTLANATMAAAGLFRDFPLIAPLLSTGSERIAPLPPHLTVDFAKVHGISDRFVNVDENNYLKSLMTKPDKDSKFTVASVAFDQNGAWRYNWDTGNWEAMIFPARSTSDASPSVARPGDAQPLLYNYGTAEKPLLRPVTLKHRDVLNFDPVYRKERVSSKESSIEYIR